MFLPIPDSDVMHRIPKPLISCEMFILLQLLLISYLITACSHHYDLARKVCTCVYVMISISTHKTVTDSSGPWYFAQPGRTTVLTTSTVPSSRFIYCCTQSITYLLPLIEQVTFTFLYRIFWRSTKSLILTYSQAQLSKVMYHS